MVILIFFISIWYLSLFSQTFFQHRYAAHGAFTMNKSWEKFFFIVTYVTQGSSYMSPKAYGIMHRLHHAHTDTPLDPHSPSNSSNIFTMMWHTRTVYQHILHQKMEVDERYSKNLPVWDGFDRFANGAFSRLLWVGLYILFFVVFATSPWQYLLLPIIISTGAFHGAIVNWFAHKYGYINFKLKNTSMNLLFVDVLMLGESYHNNHHKHPASINFGRRWFEIDPVYYIIRFLLYLNVIKSVNSSSV
ncbi:acyl-CoA desaturase [Chitinophaga sancti]|uniref:Acyl-CoA desaturase n=1 Tax=Chitinophaga sancti TaxID=1004 RepID=A0A1K1QYX7_9BACT|nr:acyl-CoA desaturase [Chitinophaga sancti]WQD62110.1 acyl-CoA desaturase [Chitinophaga sancti]WQG92321.1 acyl-CoA desaturase [Chitinophaga sancti]SFW65119.1 stearoyl-CoA desaturase (delta-9 desaturase) [Chitinophaga sancti]